MPKHIFATPKRERKSKEACRDAREWVNQEALYRIEDWAPQFFPCGYIGSQGEWRVPADELGRPHCEEALSIHCDGIKDWATGWSDHIEADKYTAIGLLKAFFTEGETASRKWSRSSTNTVRRSEARLARIALPSFWRKLSAKIGRRL